VTDRAGNLAIRSQAYTEYFVRGTEPIDYCPLHGGGGGGFWNAIATSGTSVPAAPRESDASSPATPVAMAAEPAAVAEVPARSAEAPPTPTAEQRRRGFWSRIFGRSSTPQPEASPAPADK
jgi:hypothetical protein